jgi:elongation factor Ts
MSTKTKNVVEKKSKTKALPTGKVSPIMTKELRKRTGAKLSDCRKALEETVTYSPIAWMTAAEVRLKKKEKKESIKERGVLGVSFQPQIPSLTIIEVACKTESIEKNEEFLGFSAGVSSYAELNKIESVVDLCASEIKGMSVADVLYNFSLKLGEDISLKNIIKADGCFGFFIDSSKKEGAIVDLSGITNEEAQVVGREIAIHVMINGPSYFSKNSVGLKGVNSKEKYAKKNALLEQPFYSNSDLTVEEYLVSKYPNAKIDSFVKFKIGTIPVLIHKD